MITFVKIELRRFQKILSPECLKSQREKEEEQRSSAREGALKITLHLLRNMKQQELADTLENMFLDAPSVVCQRRLKTNLKKKFECVFEGIATEGNSTLLNQIYTDVYMTEGGRGEVNTQHEVRQIETASRKPVRPETPIRVHDIFKGPPGRVKPIRTVLTKGVAGIGKTVCTQKFTLDWADGKANRNIHFTIPLFFRELNLLKGLKCSFMELLHKFFVEMKELEASNLNKYKVVFVFDGLDECRLPLDFQNNEIWTDVTEPTSVDVLVTNLIKGNLLPSAKLWITTRPAAANQIPPEFVCLVTEVRGFTDPQKDRYFTKRFSGKENMASRVMSHVKTSRSLHIMCHIPVFCCITATVLEHMLTTDLRGELPKTLTEMYIHFLVFQSIQGNVKYHGREKAESHWNTESRKTILSLGKLAFQQLEKGNLIFYESDLKECGIDLRAASVCSGVFTQIFREERGLYQSQNKVFCFVHLSIQEFLAALYVFFSFFNRHKNVLSGPQAKSNKIKKLFKAGSQSAHSFYQSAVDKTLQKEELDVFDLKKYSRSEAGLLKLQPVLEAKAPRRLL
ncbi:protein NLRC3-like [Aplochiton taeniatus]